MAPRNQSRERAQKKGPRIRYSVHSHVPVTLFLRLGPPLNIPFTYELNSGLMGQDDLTIKINQHINLQGQGVCQIKKWEKLFQTKTNKRKCDMFKEVSQNRKLHCNYLSIPHSSKKAQRKALIQHMGDLVPLLCSPRSLFCLAVAFSICHQPASVKHLFYDFLQPLKP